MLQLTGEGVLDTKRLRCRRWRADDFEWLFALYSCADVARWVGDGDPISRSEMERWLGVTDANYAARGYGMFAVVERHTDSAVGAIGLVHPNQQAEPEIKYALQPASWGQGFASELVPALLVHGAEQFGLRSIIATVAPANLTSQRVLQKAGMTLIAIRQDNPEESQTLEPGSELTSVYEWRA